MSGIGVSPCPPFAKCPGVPGILYDGNTAAWYKHNDATTVIKDGADRVSFWLDRMNYAVGAELVNQATWYTAAYWDTFNANWSQVGVALHSDGNSGFAIKNNFWTIGATYKMVVTVANLVAGDYYLYDGVTVPINIIASGTYTIYYTPGVVNLNMRSLLLNADITALSIKRITGNHLLQNVAANQPLWSAANGILFDGVSDYLRTGIAFAHNQPVFIYFVGRQVTWTNNEFFYNSSVVGNMGMYQTGISPAFVIYGGLAACSNVNLILNTFSIVRCLFSGVNSFTQVNLTAAVAGNAGVVNGTGFLLGCNTAINSWGNIASKEIIIRTNSDNAATQLSIYNYLKNANAIP